MAKNIDTLLKKLPKDALKRAQARADQMIAEMPLNELRKARALTQQNLAQTMGLTQPNLSRIEQQTDIYVQTLRSYIEAMGGELDLVAHFPDGDFRITQFGAIGEDQQEKAHA
jgi:transcriptional regulator with XRE-family HTH domain